MQELMCKKAAMEISIVDGGILCGQAGDKIFKLAAQSTKNIQIKFCQGDWSTSGS